MKKILLSLSMIGLVGVLAAGATGAWFSDTETSTGNTFTAGRLDIRIDSEQHYNGNTCTLMPNSTYQWQGPNPYPKPGTPCDGTWRETDLGAHKFFYFNDIKPGDWGENTISIHVYDNDAWGRMHLKLDEHGKDNDCTEPEGEIEMKGVPTTQNVLVRGCDADGELYQKMVFETWLDQGMIPGFQCGALNTPGRPRCPVDPYEGDNKWQRGEVPRDPSAPTPGPNEPLLPMVMVNEPMIPTEIVAMDLTSATPIIVKSGETPPPGFRPSFFDVFVELDLGLKTQLLPAVPDGQPICDPLGDGHYNYGPCHGITHDGHLVGSVTYYIGWHWKLPGQVGNEVQTDSLMGDMMFEAQQHRNNPDPWPTPPTP